MVDRPPPRADAHLGRQLAGVYTLKRLLGAGGMGAVFEAEDTAGQRFAVKLVHAELLASPALVERFLREARVGNEISSPHVVPVVDSGRETDGTLFLVMPLLRGFDLAGLLERTGPLHPSTAVRLTAQAATGLVAAHRAGVIHRDLKPSNVFLDHRGDGQVVARLCDFGVAKRAEMYDDSSLTRTGASMGSPLYMSPEQVLSAKHVDERTDVWSLGATLYELLCGITPHGDATSLAELMVLICSRNPPPLQDRAPWVTPELALLVHRALHRDPEQRFASAADLSQALAGFHDGEPILTRDALVPVDAALRATRAPRADLGPVTAPEGAPPSLPGSLAGAASVDPLLGTILGGKYRILRLLGRGGMGAVYEAEARDGARVAVKVVLAELATSHAEGHLRFLREARAAMAIRSPHVVATLDAGTDEQSGLAYIVMELLRGVDLQALLRRQGALPPRVLVRIATQAARGIAAAHAEGVIHRDIKPANLFLSTQPGQPTITVKVCDFGVAKRVTLDDTSETQAHDLTKSGTLLGSPLYMSPEQAQSAKTVGPQSDVWSLAVCLYEGLCGRQPWEACTSLGQIIVAICTAPVPWLQDEAPWVTAELAEVVHGGLERDPALRHSSMDAFIAALAPHTEGGEEVLRGELRGLDLSQRSSAARRADRTGALAAIDPDRDGQDRAHQRTTAPRRTAGLVVGALVGVTVIATGVGVGFEVATRAPAASAAPPPASDASRPDRVRGVVRIVPPDAEVTVDGSPRPVEAGRLRFDGLPGEAFEVVVRWGTDVKTVRVVMDRSGALTPDRIERSRTASTAPSAIPSRGATTNPTPRRPATPAGPPTPPAPDDGRPLVTDDFR